MTASDVVLVTVDCWRHDAPDRMSTFSSAVSGFERTDAVTQGAATNSSFPALLASRYYPSAYTPSGEVRDEVTSLPQALSSEGYETAAFVASNPFLGKWADHFDTFWNDGMVETSADDNRGQSVSSVEKIWQFLRLQDRVPADHVREKATEWLESTDGPRFLWVHLMDLHGPYYPGLRRGLDEGLLRTYLSLARHAKQSDPGDDVTETIQSLYWRCVDQFDRRLARFVDEIPDDAVVVLTGDHGEELYHGNIGHARLYDEVVRVPFYSRNLSGRSDSTVRHLDLAPCILDTVGGSVPDQWEGTSSPTDEPAFCLNHAPGFDTTYAGIRTPSEKLVYELRDGDVADHEYFDLEEDPEESLPTEPPAASDVAEQLEAFLGRDAIDNEVLGTRETGVDAVPDDRLRQLGYLE